MTATALPLVLSTTHICALALNYGLRLDYIIIIIYIYIADNSGD